MRNTTILSPLTMALTGALLLPGARLFAQDAKPSATTTAENASTPSPVSTSKRTLSEPERKQQELERARARVDELRAIVDFQVAQAQRIETRGPLAAELQGEIRRARERATDHTRVQLARVDKALAAMAAQTSELPELVEEIVELSRVTERSSEKIAGIITQGGRTEETLQEIASCFGEISEKAEADAEALAEMSEEHGTGIEVRIGENGSVHIRGDGSDRVSYGNAVVILDTEEVNDAVAMFDNLTVNGVVLGDAVALGGDLLVTKTGHVHGDAASIFGRVVVEDGGVVDGQRISLGSGALLGAFRGAPAVPQAWPIRLGSKLLTAGAQFLCFFLLGLLAVAIFPRRIAVVSEALAEHPIKAGAFGVLASIAWLPITLLLVVTIVGIILIPFFWVAYPIFGFIGYVALALIIGRKLPTKVIPTNTAVLAIGAGVIVAIGLIPVLGTLLWVLAGFFALGATLMTRFGQDRSNGNAPAVPGDMASIA